MICCGDNLYEKTRSSKRIVPEGGGVQPPPPPIHLDARINGAVHQSRPHTDRLNPPLYINVQYRVLFLYVVRSREQFSLVYFFCVYFFFVCVFK